MYLLLDFALGTWVGRARGICTAKCYHRLGCAEDRAIDPMCRHRYCAVCAKVRPVAVLAIANTRLPLAHGPFAHRAPAPASALVPRRRSVSLYTTVTVLRR